MTYHIQSRWVLSGRYLVYYGLRSGRNLFRSKVRLSRRQENLLRTLPRELTKREIRLLGRLEGVQVVQEAQLRSVPQSIQQATFCTRCCANDFIIPGLEFDSEGLCPMCQTAKTAERLRSIVPIVEDIPRAENSRFDVALFYTGGKDSTYLLYHLAKVMGLRVLALTWDIPFMSDSARKSIENARSRFPTVEFISRKVMDEDLRKIYSRLYELSGNTCACPSLAYVLFYPELVRCRVPYFMAGNEPAQMLGLYYNHMAPKAAYRFAGSRLMQLPVNLWRILTLRPPLRRGQFHTLATMKQLTKSRGSKLAALAGYENELVNNIVDAISCVPEMTVPLKKALRSSSRSGRIPAFVHLDFDRISGGSYNWQDIKQLITDECGWVAPEDCGKGLHTSCKIEKCKEHSQFSRFYHCRSRMIPFSALEISLAGRGKNLSREDAIREIESSLGFSLEEIPECEIMKRYLRGEQ